ncbi:alpha/beta fold hydrolase, partial [Streptomyces sp. NPDC054841]
PVPRVYLQGALSGELPGEDELVAAGVRVVTVPGAGHNIMFDAPDVFVRAVAATEPVTGVATGAAAGVATEAVPQS